MTTSTTDPAARTLLLVDGSSYLYRAFHAMPELKNSAGEHTGAIYGVVNMLRRLAADYPTSQRACVFDTKAPTFRDAAYAEYKAHRAPMPPALVEQLEPIHAIVEALGWPILAVDGVEADDVIGTLATQARSAGMRCVISTGDKDLAQLVNDSVTLVNTMSNEVLDPAGVLQKFGVPPARIVDYLTLIGDSVDNVPGVAKVGPKTALKWLTQYPTLDDIMAHADEIGGVVGANLRESLAWLPKARWLLTVKCDCVLPVTLDALTHDGLNTDRLRTLFSRYGFRSWLRELEGGSNDTPTLPENAQATSPTPVAPIANQVIPARRAVRCVISAAELSALINQLNASPLTGFDTETDGLEPMRSQLVGLSFAFANEAVYVPVAHRYPDAPEQLGVHAALDLLKPWLESATHLKVGQNLKFDAHILANHGVTLAGIAHDTLLESYVYEGHERHDLDTLSRRHLGWETISYDAVTGKGASRISFAEVDIQRATAYAAEDADVTLRLWRVLKPRLAAEHMTSVYETLERPLLDVLARMERRGISIDRQMLSRLSGEFAQTMARLEHEIHEAAGQTFNPASPKQLGDILFGKMGLPGGKKTATGAWATGAQILEELADQGHDLPKRILEWRQISKLKSTYADALPDFVNAETKRVHTSFSLAATTTGRLSSSDPNVQNIPVRTEEGRKIRAAFVATAGHRLLSADYSQIELRILAHIADIPALRRAFADGIDIHVMTASEMFGVPVKDMDPMIRRRAKAINFGIIYGISAFGLANQLGIGREEAGAYIKKYFERFPGIRDYMDSTKKFAREHGYVETVFGRRCHYPQINSSNPSERAFNERAAINAPIQGTAADIIRRAMIRMDEALHAKKLKAEMLLQVHDELIFEVPDSEVDATIAVVKKVMEDAPNPAVELAVPLQVDARAAKNWDEAH